MNVVPADFVIPEPPSFVFGPVTMRLAPLGEEHCASDFAAWTNSSAHIRSTPGFPWHGWPPDDGTFTIEENLADMRMHAEHFAARVGFTWTVLVDHEDVGPQVVGCVYVYPDADPAYDAYVRSWVTEEFGALDVQLREAVVDWLARDWPFQAGRYDSIN
ncbi:MAG: N-acetyltransferase [Candidatus Nanopelagicales bacterium]|nr:N-acetyltransferase [Candidatus Nanopelagicales bacterium]